MGYVRTYDPPIKARIVEPTEVREYQVVIDEDETTWSMSYGVKGMGQIESDRPGTIIGVVKTETGPEGFYIREIAPYDVRAPKKTAKEGAAA